MAERTTEQREIDKRVAERIMGIVPCDESPHYSTDISAAMTVWQKLRESGRWCCLLIDSDYHYTWGIKLTEASLDPEDKHEPAIRTETSNPGLSALAELICRSALSAYAD